MDVPVENRDGGPSDSQKRKIVVRWLKNQLRERLPITDWFPKYDWREDFVFDLLSGTTTAFIHVPQGLAFAMLANVEPILGLYTACFSTLVYTLLGTAQRSSVGPVAVASMLIGEAVASNSDGRFTNNEIAIALTFNIGVIYVLAFALRLGVLANIFIKPFTAGFITGCALHIIVKTLKLLLGLKLESEYGMLNLFKNIYKLFSRVGESSLPTVILSSVVMAVLILNVVLFKPLMKKCTQVILPIEAIVMTVSIIVSYCFNFVDMDIDVVGNVPVGFPSFVPPLMEASLRLWPPAIAIAIINYSTTTSMTIMFNKRLEPNQELLALGVTNLICCNIQCISIGNSMMRTVIAISVGSRTLMSSIVSCIILFITILFAGPLFSPLPTPVLGCIVMMGVIMLIIGQLKSVPNMFRSSLEDSFIWTVTLLSVLITNIDYGLIVGAVLSMRKLLSEKEKTEQKSKNQVQNEDEEQHGQAMSLKYSPTKTTV